MTSSPPQRTRATRSSTALILNVLGVLGVLGGEFSARAQEPPAPQAVSAAQLNAAIDKLGDLDYATRTNASRLVRRTAAAQAVPALLQTVAEHRDGYVRYRALVLLTGFNDPRTKDAMRASLKSPNDRLRAVAYSFFEHNPDPAHGRRLPRGARQRAGRVCAAGAGARARGARRPTKACAARSYARSAAARTSSEALSSRRSATIRRRTRSTR